MISATGTLNTNSKGASAASLTLTTETFFSLYIIAATGRAGVYRVAIEFSPDSGTTWVESKETLSEPGILTCDCVTTKARVKVIESEGDTSTVIVHLLAS